MKNFLTFTCVVLMVAMFGCSKKTNAGLFEGKVILTVGSVLVDGAPAAVDAAVKADSAVKTGKDSICEIVFNGKNILHILENTSLKLDMQARKKGIKIESGGLEAVVKNLGRTKDGKPVPFEVETQTAVAAVRGTTFYIRVADSSNTILCDCNGVIDLANPGMTNERTVESRHHTPFVFSSDKKGMNFKQLKIKYKNDMELKKKAGHNDRDMNELAAKIGVKIDWSHVDRENR